MTPRRKKTSLWDLRPGKYQNYLPEELPSVLNYFSKQTAGIAGLQTTLALIGLQMTHTFDAPLCELMGVLKCSSNCSNDKDEENSKCM